MWRVELARLSQTLEMYRAAASDLLSELCAAVEASATFMTLGSPPTFCRLVLELMWPWQLLISMSVVGISILLEVSKKPQASRDAVPCCKEPDGREIVSRAVPEIMAKLGLP